MKALSIYEPWAAYIDHGHKCIETTPTLALSR